MIKVLDFFICNWEPIVAVLGFLISLLNLWYLLKNNRKSINIREIFYTKNKYSGNYFYELNMILTNKSRLPISIVDVSFENKGKLYSSKLDRTKISSYKDPKNGIVNFYSSEFPINLNGLESSKEMLLFCLEEEINIEKLKLIITTSRGKIKKKINFEGKNISVHEYLDRILKNG